MPHALVFDSNKQSATPLSRLFSDNDFSVDTANDLSTAQDALLRQMPEVVLINLNDEEAPATREAIFDFLSGADLANVIEIYLMSKSPTFKLAADGMRAGACDIFEYPADMERLGSALRDFHAEMTCELAPEQQAHKSARGKLKGESPAMQRLYRMVRKVAASEVTVFLAGESGTGKEIISQTLHELSPRKHCPYITVNCGAIAHELAESELFGHTKGAFTGANQSHKGFFEQASGGSLFLDEVTEMSPDLQVKLLRVLETGSYRPVGAERDLKADVRIIASTNRDPEQAVAEQVLREDLYYRLAQFPIRVPPLRERGTDVALLAQLFLDDINEQYDSQKTYCDDVLEALRLYHWPGNVRELKNLVARAHLLAGSEICIDDLPSNVLTGKSADSEQQLLRVSVGHTLADVERRMIFATLEHCQGDKKQTAEMLGVSLKTLYNRLKKYQLKLVH